MGAARHPGVGPGLVAGLVVLGSAGAARGELELSGAVESQLRYVIEGKTDRIADPMGELREIELVGRGFSFNENTVKLRLEAGLSEHVRAVAEVDMVWTGFSETRTLADATQRGQVDPFRLDAHAAYLEVNELACGLDLRLGRQIVNWGTADRFNPTNFANALDLRYVLRFGRPIANEMLWLRYAPLPELRFEALAIPMFRPGVLPPSAQLALASLDRIRIQDATFRRNLAGLLALTPPVGVDAEVSTPEATIESAQAAARVAALVGEVDVSVSYYVGRDDLPQPDSAFVYVDPQGAIRATGHVIYPRYQAAGADLATSVEALAGAGLWAEGAVFFPDRVELALLTAPELGGGELRADANGDPVRDGSGRRGVNVPDEPFVKWTVGGDITVPGPIYINVQWVHGFIDEFGAGDEIRRAADDPARELVRPRLGDYLVAGADWKLSSDRVLLRAFGVWKIAEKTGVVFPQLSWLGWEGVDVSLGAYLLLGDADTKFGDPAAGGSEAFAQVRASF